MHGSVWKKGRENKTDLPAVVNLSCYRVAQEGKYSAQDLRPLGTLGSGTQAGQAPARVPQLRFQPQRPVHRHERPLGKGPLPAGTGAHSAPSCCRSWPVRRLHQARPRRSALGTRKRTVLCRSVFGGPEPPSWGHRLGRRLAAIEVCQAPALPSQGMRCPSMS